MVKLRRKLTLILNPSDLSTNSNISVTTNSILKHLTFYLRMMINSGLSWLMVMEHYSLPFKEIIEKFFKRYKYNCLRSMVEEDSLQFVSHVLGRKRGTII